MVSCTSSYMIIWSGGLARPHDKLKPSYFHHHNSYDNLTRLVDNLPWGAPTHKSRGPLITKSCKIKWQTKNITSRLSEYQWLPKLGRLVAYLDRLLSINSHKTLITWYSKMTWQTKPAGVTLYNLLHIYSTFYVL